MKFLETLPVRDALIFGLGFFAQSLFGARTLVQWIRSEREGRVTSPSLFWIFSLAGSSLFLVYGILRHDFVILLGQTLSFYIYIRNLQLKNVWIRIPQAARIFLVLVPLFLFGITYYLDASAFKNIFERVDFSDSFILLGSVGQLLLNFRYVYQWYHSEKAKQSLLPLGFWIISAVASVMVVVYGIYRHDPVLLTAQGLGLLVYVRNIYWSMGKR